LELDRHNRERQAIEAMIWNRPTRWRLPKASARSFWSTAMAACGVVEHCRPAEGAPCQAVLVAGFEAGVMRPSAELCTSVAGRRSWRHHPRGAGARHSGNRGGHAMAAGFSLRRSKLAAFENS